MPCSSFTLCVPSRHAMLLIRFRGAKWSGPIRNMLSLGGAFPVLKDTGGLAAGWKSSDRVGVSERSSP